MKKFISFLLLVALVSCNKPDVEDVAGCYLKFTYAASSGDGTRYYRDKRHVVEYTTRENVSGAKKGDSTAYTYKKGKLIKAENYKDGSKISYDTYELGENENVVFNYSADGKVQSKSIYKLSGGKVTEWQFYWPGATGDLVLVNRTEATMDAAGNVSEAKMYSQDGKLQLRILQEFDGKPNPIQTTPLLFIGLQSKHNVIKNVQYDKDGKQISETINSYIYNDKGLPIEQRDSAGKPLTYYQYDCE